MSSTARRSAGATCRHSSKLEGRRIGAKGGHGLFAREPIGRDEVLVVWGGEVIDGAAIGRLPRDARRLCMQIEEDLFLLTTRESPADWVNHSCDPTGGLRGQVVLVSRREILPGEEITFDYAMSDGSPYDEFDCACGAAACRGRVTADDWRLPELQRLYRGHFSPYLEHRIARDARRRPRRPRFAPELVSTLP